MRLRTAMLLPRRFRFSTYVPGATRTVSPAVEASMADWMVE